MTISAKHPTLLSRLKMLLVRSGREPRRILFGPFRGISMGLDLSFQTQLYLGLYEAELHPALQELSKGIRSAVNIGAAFGEQTLFFLKKTPAELVLSFEPEASAREQLLSNLKLNGLENTPWLRLSSKFVGAQESTEMCTLDGVAASLPQPCLVMMDVEGCEAAILEGAGALLKSSGTRWIVETWIQPVSATPEALKTSAGVLNPRHFLGR